MAIFTIKINERSSLGRAIMELLRSSARESKAVEIVDDKNSYSPEFVKKIKKAQSRGSYREVNPKDLWGSIK